MISYFFDINLVVDMIQTIASIAVIIDCIEVIIERYQYSSKGIFNFEFSRMNKKWMLHRYLDRFFNILFGYPNYILLIIVQLVVGVLVISQIFINFSIFLILIIFIILLLSHVRNHLGMSGADQMQVIIFTCLLVFYLSPSNSIVQKLAIFFICFQSLLSYFVSGLAKLSSSTWKNGTAITDIMNTESFGNKVFAKILIDKPSLSKLVCWCIILFECSFPMLIYTGLYTASFFIIFGILFHLSIAILMRFNSFFWSFIATYPALLYLATEIQNVIRSIS
jgi:hypothetical protein